MALRAIGEWIWFVGRWPSVISVQMERGISFAGLELRFFLGGRYVWEGLRFRGGSALMPRDRGPKAPEDGISPSKMYTIFYIL